jgi:hypothetical protein
MRHLRDHCCLRVPAFPVFDWQNPAGGNFALYFAFSAALPILFDIGSHVPGERLASSLSYPIYICHGAVESTILALLLHERMSLLAWIAVNVLMVVAASVLLLVLTAPVETFRQRFKSARPSMPSSAQLA